MSDGTEQIHVPPVGDVEAGDAPTAGTAPGAAMDATEDGNSVLGPDSVADPVSEVDTVAVPPRKLGMFAAVGLVVLVLDQASKSWALSALDGGRIIDVVGSLRFELAFNTGASFGMGSGRGIGPWVTVIAMGMVLALALGSTSRTTLGAVAAGLIGGGAVGNLIDRAVRGDQGFMHGAVVDFIDLQWWPVFNVADMGVVVGAILLVVAGLRAP